MQAAQAEARRALAAGTYFILGGVVTDSRGRELGAPEDVLGPGYADEKSKRPADPARGPRDLAALHGAGLTALRDALEPSHANDELESYVTTDDAARGGLGSSMRSGVGGAKKGGKRLTKAEMEANWDALC